LCHYAGYNEIEIEPVFKLMVDYLARPVTHEAFFKKYASKKFLKGKQCSITNECPILTTYSLDFDETMGQEACC